MVQRRALDEAVEEAIDLRALLVAVAAASLLPSAGFLYDREFFTAEDPWVRAAAVRTQPTSELLRWRIDPAALAELLGRVDAMSASELGDHLARRRPPTVKVALAGGGPVLVPIAWERLGSVRPRPGTGTRPRLRTARE